MATVTVDSGKHTVRRSAGSSLVSLLGAAAAGGGGILVSWLVARALSPTAAGAFFTSTSLFLLLASIARLGTPTSVVYWIASKRKAAQLGALGDIYRNAFLAPLVGAGACSLLLLTFASYLPNPTLAAILAAVLPLAVVSEILLAAGRGFNRMGPTVAIEKIGRTLSQVVLLAVVAVAFSGNLTATTLAWSMPYLPAALLAAWTVWRLPRAHGQNGSLPARDFWSFTGPRAAASVVQLALQRLDIVLVGALAGLEAAAVYTVATRFIVVGQMVSGAIGQALQPRIAANVGQPAKLSELYQTSTAWIVALTWPIYISIAMSADIYLRLFGSDYIRGDARTVIWILAPSMMVAAACGIVDTVLAMAGKTSWQFYNVSIALAVNIVLNVVLIPRIGIVGAALAWAVSLMCKNLIPLYQVYRGFGYRPWGTLCLTCIACSGLHLILIILCAQFGTSAQLIGTGIGLLAWGVIVLGYARRLLSLWEK